MPYCHQIYNGLTIDSDARVRPCCHIDDTIGLEQVFIDEFDYTAETNFPKLAKVMETEWHDACRPCIQEENLGNISPRIYANERYKNLPAGQYNIIDLKLSNTCNLSCVMCNSGASSTWHQIVKQNPDLVEYNNELYPDSIDRDFEIKNNVLSIMDNIKFLKLSGGEPFLIKKVKKLCKDLIAKHGDVSNIDLQITTNGNVILDDEWYNILNKFNTDLNISVDGLGSRYEYIRPGSSWKILQEFIKCTKQKYTGKVNITVVAQALNYIQIPLIREWAKDNGFEYDISEILYHPFFLNNSSVNPKLRKKYGVPTIHEWNPDNFIKMQKYLERLDKIHGKDFKTECREFFE